MGIPSYNGKCDNCSRDAPSTFLQVWRHTSKNEGIKPQFWCFDCIHGRNFLPEIKNSVTFVFLKKEGKYVPNGTGFLVSVQVEKEPYYSYHQAKNTPYYVMYLATAKHVLQDSKGEYYPVVSVRANTHDGKSKYLDIDLDKAEIFTHNDNDVDIAVISLSLDPKIFDYKLIPEYIIPDQKTVKKLEISEGDEVFFSGLFESHYGQQKNQPIIRFGKVALITDEKIEYKEKEMDLPKLLDLYLLECQSYGGNSGSPVFFNLLRQQWRKLDEQGLNVYLAGIIKGSFHRTEIFTADTFLMQNVGIAAVTPSYKLQEILYSKQTSENRSSATEYYRY